MIMAGRSLRLQVFSGILKEFQLAKQTGSPSYQYLLEQYKANQVRILYKMHGPDTHHAKK